MERQSFGTQAGGIRVHQHGGARVHASCRHAQPFCLEECGERSPALKIQGSTDAVLLIMAMNAGCLGLTHLQLIQGCGPRLSNRNDRRAYRVLSSVPGWARGMLFGNEHNCRTRDMRIAHQCVWQNAGWATYLQVDRETASITTTASFVEGRKGWD